jgi:hypothetical protein
MKGPSPIELSENHRRSVSITLQLVDKTLCQWDDWTNGHVRSGVMYSEQDTFSAAQKDELRNKIAKIRQLMTRMHTDLRLEAAAPATSQSIVGQSALLWEMLVELNSHSLGGYGKVSGQLATYLDPIGTKLAEEVNEIARLFSQPASGD